MHSFSGFDDLDVAKTYADCINHLVSSGVSDRVQGSRSRAFLFVSCRKNARVLEIGFGLGSILNSLQLSKRMGLDYCESACT